MSNPWKKVTEPTLQSQNLSDIMSEQYARGLQVKEELKFAEHISDQHVSTSDDIDPELLKQIEEANLKEFCDSDAIIAKVLQCQFDKEYDEEIKRVEKKRNGDAKVSVSYDNYRTVPENLIYDTDSEDEDVEVAENKDWDRFETNEKEFASLPKRGYAMRDGEMVTKHDSVISGRRNACRVMAFPPEVCTGDGAGFDMKLPNSVFNHLKEQTRHHQSRKHKMLDRKEMQATAEMGLDEPTRLILFKLINNGMLENINGIISTGKESVVLHAHGDTSYEDLTVPKECAIKVFKTTLNEFKTRDKYIEADYRFKDRFSKQNPRKIVHMWAEKEMHNMMRLQKIGVNCPEMVCLKKHILVMSFIGRDNKPAPKLRDVILKPEKWQSVYNEVVENMHKMYNVGHIIHADLSEYNILWWENKCWFIDVSQSVQPDHPSGLEFLLRDCRNICNFFDKKGVQDMKSADELFKSITGFEEVDVNLLEGVHTTFNSLSCRFEISLDDNRNTSYPFEYCWVKSNEAKKSDKSGNEESEDDDDEFEEMWTHSIKNKVDTAADFGNVVPIATGSKETANIVDNNVNFGNELNVTIPKPQQDIHKRGIDKKS
ncbi:serine/threonine-protein kinase RIO3 [Pectinophora gossypiella]|uniref:Serine/threonine-protein kinase RIO3 n=1 Tax=Pectinophora gossypiella TaxID=13191 RepID=A0A1E1WK44_PECGO|nr:serine/threonine-protein kinase RIO3 [Pectinophora gossypiella]